MESGRVLQLTQFYALEIQQQTGIMVLTFEAVFTSFPYPVCKNCGLLYCAVCKRHIAEGQNQRQSKSKQSDESNAY